MDTLPFAMLVLGLVSSVHCAGMCGGIVAAFSTAQPVLFRRDIVRNQLAFNTGRIATYSAAGALAGLLGSAAAYASEAAGAQAFILAAANLVVVVIGLQLAGVRSPFARLESLGAPLWRRLQPLAARLRPGTSLPGSLAAGLVWGWLPCGLVYGALAVAVLSGSAARGALMMLAFGLGTLPALMAAGIAAAQLRRWFARPAIRLGAGASVVASGMYGLAHAGGVAEAVQRTLLCL